MKKNLTTAIFLIGCLLATAQPATISGTWERRSNDVVLYSINTGTLERVAIYTVDENNRNFSFAFTPPAEGAFYVIGNTREGAPSGKHLFYFKPGDRLELVIQNDSTYMLIGNSNSKENQAIAAWQNHVLQLQNSSLFPMRFRPEPFLPLLEQITQTPFQATLTGNKAFDETFAQIRRFDILYYAGRFARMPRGQGHNASEFFRSMRFSEVSNSTAVLQYPFAFDLLSGVFFVESQIRGESFSPQRRMAAVVNDTLRGEMFLNHLQHLTDMATLNVWREQYEKYLFSDAQKQRLQNHITHLTELAAQPQEAAPRRDNNQRVPLATNTPAPNFTYNNTEGKPVSLSDFKGKVVYIDIWATWCGPCRAEIPHLKALKEKYKDNENLVIIGISADAVGDVQRWKDFVTAQELTGVQLHGRTDGDDDVAALFGVRALPHFVLIDKQGNIASGQAPRASSADIVPMIERLLQ